MEELWELRRYLEASDVAGALALLDEMEAMAKDDKIDRIGQLHTGATCASPQAGRGTAYHQILASLHTQRPLSYLPHEQTP